MTVYLIFIPLIFMHLYDHRFAKSKKIKLEMGRLNIFYKSFFLIVRNKQQPLLYHQTADDLLFLSFVTDQ